MGIFDDAIREHLELKRHAGADAEELQELEDEAFGPPARPGEADFPGSTGEDAGEPGAQGASAPFDAAAEATEAPDDSVSEPPAGGETAPRNEAVGALQEAPATEPEDEAADSPTESPAAPFDAFADTPELQTPDDGSTFTTEEREAIADQPTVFFEQQEPAELELGDLDLDLDEEIEEVEEVFDEPLADEEPLAADDAPDDEPAAAVEPTEAPHELEPEPAPPTEAQSAPEAEVAQDDTSEYELPAEEDSMPLVEEDDQETDEGQGADEEEGADEEDVLEETPEFLRDNPDDDELWFEQGEPKDFDF